MIKLLQIFFILFLMAANVFAEELPITGTVQQQIPVTHANKLYPNGFKYIRLLEYELPLDIQEGAYQQVTRRLEQLDRRTQDLNTILPKKVQLGMANVPVLDQGIHGSCGVWQHWMLRSNAEIILVNYVSYNWVIIWKQKIKVKVDGMLLI